MTFDNQKDYWNKVARDKEFTTSVDLELIAPFLTTNALIVDYGCGYGRTLNELYAHGFKNSIGFDFSDEMIQRGRLEYPHLNLKTGKNNKIDCFSDSVDLVILFAVLTCIIDNNKQKQLLEEISRVLKPEGFIYINDFLLNNDERNLQRYKASADKYGTFGVFELPEGAILRHHDEKWIPELTAGFKQEALKKIEFKTMNDHVSNGFVFLGRKQMEG
jgi:SAM-dependent methyltransferase